MDPNTLTTIAMIALMIVAFYFLILRPQRKRQADQAKTIQSLTPGTRVLTSTGIYGKLVRLGDQQAVIELSPGNEMTVLKHAIARVVKPGEEDLESVGVADPLSAAEVEGNETSIESGSSSADSNWEEVPVGSSEASADEAHGDRTTSTSAEETDSTAESKRN